MSDSDKLIEAKPAHIPDKRWKQHLTWMDVMHKQVSENIKAHPPRLFRQEVKK